MSWTRLYSLAIATFLTIIFVTIPITFAKKGESGDILPTEDEKDTQENGGPQKVKIGQLYLPEDYNKYEIPNAASLGLNGPLYVRVHIAIREIQDLNELDGRISVVMDVRLKWSDTQIFKANQDKIKTSDDGFDFAIRRKRSEEDSRLTKTKTLDPSFLSEIWKPDLFMESLFETSRPEFIAKPIKLVYMSDGWIVLQTRLSVTVSCGMEFLYYPADSQECFFKIRSYSYRAEELELEWGYPKPSVYAFDRSNSNFDIQVTEPKLDLLVEPSLDDIVVEMDYAAFGLEPPVRKNDSFYILEFSIKARRKMSYHMIQTYVPSFFFIGITWLCFFIPPTMVECRIGITMTTLLTLTAMFAAVREGSPSVSYCKAIDIWMVACVVFVFSCLVEFALLVWFGLTKDDEGDGSKKENGEEIQLQTKLEMDSVLVRGTANGTRKGSNSTKHTSGGVALARRIEYIAVPTYLLLFVVFQLIYWPWLMGSSGFFEWTVNTTYNAPD